LQAENSKTHAAMEPHKSPEIDLNARTYGTVLVVGGCGFLGSRLVDQLLNFPSEEGVVKTSPKMSSSYDNSTVSSQLDFSHYPPQMPKITPTQTPNPAKYNLSQPTPTAFPTLRSRYPPTKGTSVHVLDLRCTQHIFDGATYHSGDITNAEQVLEIFRKVKPDVVINTASPSWEAPHSILRQVNIEGTRTLLEVAGGKTHGSWGGEVKAFIHTSSASVVHDGESNLRFATEEYPLVHPNPKEYYSETKALAEQLVLSANANDEYSEKGAMLTCAVRPAGIIGEGDRGGFSGGILRASATSPSWQLHVQFGENTGLFDNTYVYNVCHGLLCTATALLETHRRKQAGKIGALSHEKVDGEAFNVTNNSPCYFWDGARYLMSRYGRTINLSRVWNIPASLAETVGLLAETFNWMFGRQGKLTRQTVKYMCIDRYYSCEKLMRRTGYVPVVGLDEGFARSVRWFKEDEKAQGKEWKKER
jgi:sterol-4alpha-carboxylate 3-dehydrogenase (decarboxylating)